MLRTYTTKAKVKTIKNSGIVTTFKSILKSIATVKNNFGKFLWSIIQFLRLDIILTPSVLKLFKFTGKSFKYVSYLFILFNFLLISWLCYYNSPFLTYKIIFGWIVEFIPFIKDNYRYLI